MPRDENGSVTISTLGDLADLGSMLWIYCDSSSYCHYGSKLDLEVLIERFGRDHGCLHADLVRHRWKCSRCGGRKVTFRATPFHPSSGKNEGQPDSDLPF